VGSAGRGSRAYYDKWGKLAEVLDQNDDTDGSGTEVKTNGDMAPTTSALCSLILGFCTMPPLCSFAYDLCDYMLFGPGRLCA
jgi:hypothetical protein